MSEGILKRAREVLDYDRSTGQFTWKKTLSFRTKQGDLAGCINIVDGYKRISIDRRLYPAHRLVWLFENGKWPDNLIDHINGVRDDNRIENLRDVSRKMNVQNTRRAFVTNKSSGLLGVSYHKQSGLWHAQIIADGVRHSLKYHKTKEAAHDAYLIAKRKLHDGCTI